MPLKEIRKCRDAGEAFRLACIASCLDPKEIYTELGIDQGSFSKMLSNKATLKADLWPLFSQIVGNHVFLKYMALKEGFLLVPDDGAHEDGEDRVSALENKLDKILAALTRNGHIEG